MGLGSLNFRVPCFSSQKSVHGWLQTKTSLRAGEKRKSRTHDSRRGCAFRGPTPDFGPTHLVRTCELQPLKTLALRMFSDTFRRAVGGRWGNTHVLAVLFGCHQNDAKKPRDSLREQAPPEFWRAELESGSGVASD